MVSVLLFKNTGCASCARFEPVFHEVLASFAGRAEGRIVDISKEMPVAIEHGVLSMPTVLILKDGAEVKRLMGAVAKQQLANAISSVL